MLSPQELERYARHIVLREVGGRALDKPVDIRRLSDAIRYSATGARIFRKGAQG